MNRKWVPALVTGMCIVSSLSVIQPAFSAGNSAVKIDNNDDDQPDDTAKPTMSESDENVIKQVSTLIQQQHYDNAQHVLAQAAQANPKSLAVKRMYMYFYLTRKQPKAAVQIAEEMQRLGGMTSADKVLAGTAYYQINSPTQAETAFRDATVLDANDSSAEISYIKMMIANKKWQRAIAECDKGLARFKTGAANTDLRRLKAEAANGHASGTVDSGEPPKVDQMSSYGRRGPGG